MTIKISTSWFTDIYEALRFYCKKGISEQKVEEKLVNKEIFLGTPPKRNQEQKRFIDNDGRWVIIVKV